MVAGDDKEERERPAADPGEWSDRVAQCVGEPAGVRDEERAQEENARKGDQDAGDRATESGGSPRDRTELSTP
jgi:hypothetical protein